MTARHPMILRGCPACTRRPHQLVAATCPICGGTGVLRLGAWPAAPEVVAKAVEYALELQAQKDLAGKPFVPAVARRNLTAMVVKLTRFGLLANFGVVGPVGSVQVTATVPGPVAHNAARLLAEAASGLPYTEGTAAVLAAPAAVYDPADVAVDGMLPPFSAGGFIAGLAQVTFPIDPLEVHHKDSARINRQGEVLGKAAAN